MDYGLAGLIGSESWKIVQRAEQLGFSHAWFYDSPLYVADLFVAMTAAAMKTSRIRLGRGLQCRPPASHRQWPADSPRSTSSPLGESILAWALVTLPVA